MCVNIHGNPIYTDDDFVIKDEFKIVLSQSLSNYKKLLDNNANEITHREDDIKHFKTLQQELLDKLNSCVTQDRDELMSQIEELKQSKCMNVTTTTESTPMNAFVWYDYNDEFVIYIPKPKPGECDIKGPHVTVHKEITQLSDYGYIAWSIQKERQVIPYLLLVTQRVTIQQHTILSLSVLTLGNK
jgi:hypothetical protein